MWTRESIKVIGNNNRNIKTRYFKHETKKDLLTIIVAGFGYTMDAPYIYYSKYIPYQLDSDVLLLDLEYSYLKGFTELKEEKKDEWFENDFLGIKKSVNELSKKYSRIWQIGKSLGTTIIFKLLKDEEINKKTEKVVWMTPGSLANEIYSLIPDIPISSFVVYGSNDPYNKDNQIEKLRTKDKIKILRIKNGDHSLETDNIEESIEYLRVYIENLKYFFEQK